MTCPALCVVALLPISGFHVGAVPPGEKHAFQKHLPHTHPREIWEGRGDGTVGMKTVFSTYQCFPQGCFAPPFCPKTVASGKHVTRFYKACSRLLRLWSHLTQFPSWQEQTPQKRVRHNKRSPHTYCWQAFGNFCREGLFGASVFISSYGISATGLFRSLNYLSYLSHNSQPFLLFSNHCWVHQNIHSSSGVSSWVQQLIQSSSVSTHGKDCCCPTTLYSSKLHFIC